jgi:alkanesulfonate monooxygenase SsuD/methylene tetrahydromethanopterin reductase-like flavin-dependent oxidoreductase (luciferase family)
MHVGVGLPAMVPGRDGATVTRWARAAEAHGFSSLAVNDVLTDDNLEPLMTLAAAAAVTERCRLLTAILIAPLHTSTPLLSKQISTLDVLSGGRATIGLGVGGRAADYRLCGVDFHRRGRLLEAQLAFLEGAWRGAGDSSLPALGPAPHQPEGPRILIGSSSPEGLRRLGRFGDGYIGGFGPPERFAQLAQEADRAWAAGGRPGRPYKAALVQYALGPHARESSQRYFDAHAPSFGGGEFKDRMVAAVVADDAAIADQLRRYSAAGCDELIFMPCAAHVDQVSRLAGACSSAATSQFADSDIDIGRSRTRE